jgi:hypothetical protein
VACLQPLCGNLALIERRVIHDVWKHLGRSQWAVDTREMLIA